MSSVIRSLKLIDLCTPSINYDAQVQSACEAFDPQLYEIIDETGQVIMIPNIMGLTDEDLIDSLAWQFHVDFYDRTAPLEERKNLVQLSIQWHMSKGTVWLVQSVLDFYWPGGASISEWFDYYSPLPPQFATIPADQLRATFWPDDVNVGTDTFNAVAAALKNGMQITFKKGNAANVLPAPIAVGTNYWVINWTKFSFQISASLNGPPLAITAPSTGTNEIWQKSNGTGDWHDRYRFRIYIDSRVIVPADEAKVLALIANYKPISRWCEGIFHATTSDLNIGWYGGVLMFNYIFSDAPNYP